MSDKMRWRHGDTNPVVAAVDAGTVIEVGDLLWQDVDDAKPASTLPVRADEAEAPLRGAPQQQFDFAQQFLGVAMQRSRSGDTATVRVATTGVFEFDCPNGTFELGDLVGVDSEMDKVPEWDEPTYRLLNQQVTKSRHAIGRVAKREPIATGSVLVDIRSTVMTGGV